MNQIIPAPAAADEALLKKTDNKKQKLIDAIAKSIKKTKMSEPSLRGSTSPAFISIVMITIEIIRKRKYCVNHADQCTHDCSPIIFIVSFSRFSFSWTTLRCRDKTQSNTIRHITQPHLDKKKMLAAKKKSLLGDVRTCVGACLRAGVRARLP